MDCDLAHFCLLIRQRAERLPPTIPRVRDPYQEIDQLVIESHTQEAHVLIELVTALERGNGSFRETEVFALDAHALRIADALIEQAMMGYAGR